MTLVLDRPAVTPADEAKAEELVIRVTQADIDNGIRGNSGWCPIVLAANRLSRGGSWSMSTSGVLEFVPQWPGRREYWLSVSAGDFAFAFDKDRTSAHPTTFRFTRDSAVRTVSEH